MKQMVICRDGDYKCEMLQTHWAHNMYACEGDDLQKQFCVSEKLCTVPIKMCPFEEVKFRSGRTWQPKIVEVDDV